MIDETHLTPEERAEYREWRRGFESKFWRKLRADLEQELEALPLLAFHNSKSQEDLNGFKARAAAIAQLAAYEEIIEKKYESIALGRQQEADEQSQDSSVRYL